MAKNTAAAGVKASSSKYVTVACKIPTGLILQNYKMEDTAEAMQGGGTRMVKRAVKDGIAIRVHGTARPLGEAPRCSIVMGFAMTPRVPAEHWERWLAANKDMDMVQNGLIFANPDSSSLRDEAKDNRKQLSGLEPLKHENDPRSPRNKKKKLKVAKADEQSEIDEGDEDPDNIEVED